MVYKTLSYFPKGRYCQLCLSTKVDPEALGNICQTADVIVHYFCLLLASQIQQKGTDKQGLLGFFSRDIKKEIKRGSTVACNYCKKNGATVTCSGQNCHLNFHVPCAQENRSLHQYFGEFKSFCEKHKPRQKLPAVLKERKDLECVLCSANIVFSGRYYRDDPLWPTCCKPQALAHKKCLQHFATSSGYYFKCPFCSNKTDFYSGMKIFGIYIPEQEASWETEPNAYRELLERNVSCVARTCSCPRGRDYSIRNSKWQLELCVLCGASGQHRGCLLEPITPGTYECTVCSQVNARYTASVVSSEPEDEPELSPIVDDGDVIQQPVQDISLNASMECENIVVISDSESEEVNVEDINEDPPALKNLRKRHLPARQEKRLLRKRQRLAECGAETSSELCLTVEEDNGTQVHHEKDPNISPNHLQACGINSQIIDISVQPNSPIVIDHDDSALFIAKVCTLSDCNQTEINEIMSDEINKEGRHNNLRNINYIDLVSDDGGDEVLVISDTDDESIASSLLESESSLLDLSEIPETERSLLLDHFSSHNVEDFSVKTQKPKRKRKKKKVFTHTKKRKSVYTTPCNKGKSNKRCIETFNDKLINESPDLMKDCLHVASNNSASFFDASCINLSNLSSNPINQVSTSNVTQIEVAYTKETMPFPSTNNKSLIDMTSSLEQRELYQSDDGNVTYTCDNETSNASHSNQNEIDYVHNTNDANVLGPIKDNELLNNFESIVNNHDPSSSINVLTGECNSVNTSKAIFPVAKIHSLPNDEEIGNMSQTKNVELSRSECCSLSSDANSHVINNSTFYKTPPYEPSAVFDSISPPNVIACEEKLETKKVGDTIHGELSQISNVAMLTTESCDYMAVQSGPVSVTNSYKSYDSGETYKVHKGKNKIKNNLKRKHKQYSRRNDQSTLIQKKVSDNTNKVSKNSSEKLKILCSISLEQPVREVIHSILNMRDRRHHVPRKEKDSEVTVLPLADKDSALQCSDHFEVQSPVAITDSSHVDSQPPKQIVTENKVEEHSVKLCPFEVQVDLPTSEISPSQGHEEIQSYKLNRAEVAVSLQPPILGLAEGHSELLPSKLKPAKSQFGLQSSKLSPAKHKEELLPPKLSPTEDKVELIPLEISLGEKGVKSLSSKHSPNKHCVSLQSCKLDPAEVPVNLKLPRLSSTENQVELQFTKLPEDLVRLQSSDPCLPTDKVKLQLSLEVPSDSELKSSETSPGLKGKLTSEPRPCEDNLETRLCKPILSKNQLKSQSIEISPEFQVLTQLSAQSQKVPFGIEENSLVVSVQNNFKKTYDCCGSKSVDNLISNSIPFSNKNIKQSYEPLCTMPSSCCVSVPDWYNICKSDCSTCRNSTSLIVKQIKQNISTNESGFTCCVSKNNLNNIGATLNSFEKNISYSLKTENDFLVNYSSVIEHYDMSSKVILNDNQIKLIEKINGSIQPGSSLFLKSELNKSFQNFTPFSNYFSKNMFSLLESDNKCFSNEPKIPNSEIKKSLIDLHQTNRLENSHQEVEATVKTKLFVCNLPDIVISAERSIKSNTFQSNSIPDFVQSSSPANSDYIKTHHSSFLSVINNEKEFFQNNMSQFNKSEIIFKNFEASITKFCKDRSIFDYEKSIDSLLENIEVEKSEKNLACLRHETTDHCIECERELNSPKRIDKINQLHTRNNSPKLQKQLGNNVNKSNLKICYGSLKSINSNINTSHSLMQLNTNLQDVEGASQIMNINSETVDATEKSSATLNVSSFRKTYDHKFFSARIKHEKLQKLYSNSNEVFKVRITYQKVNGNDEKPPLFSEIETFWVLNAQLFRQRLMEKFFSEDEKKVVIYTDACGFRYVRLFVENIPQIIDCTMIFESEGNMSSYLEKLIKFHKTLDVVRPLVVLIVCCNSTHHGKDVFHFLQLASKLNNIKLVVTTLLSRKTRVLKFNRKLIYYSQKYGYYVWDISKITFQIEAVRR